MSLKRTWQRRAITPTLNGKQTKTSKRHKRWKRIVITLALVSCFTTYSLIKLFEGINTQPEILIALETNTMPQNPSPQLIQAEIEGQARLFNINPASALKLAECESGFQFDAKNPKSTARGVYQYLISIWEETESAKHGLERNNYKANIREAMLDLANGEAWRWSECVNKYNLTF